MPVEDSNSEKQRVVATFLSLLTELMDGTICKCGVYLIGGAVTVLLINDVCFVLLGSVAGR